MAHTWAWHYARLPNKQKSANRTMKKEHEYPEEIGGEGGVVAVFANPNDHKDLAAYGVGSTRTPSTQGPMIKTQSERQPWLAAKLNKQQARSDDL